MLQIALPVARPIFVYSLTTTAARVVTGMAVGTTLTVLAALTLKRTARKIRDRRNTPSTIPA